MAKRSGASILGWRVPDKLPTGFRRHVEARAAAQTSLPDEVTVEATATLMRGESIGRAYVVLLRMSASDEQATISRLLHLADSGAMRDCPVLLKVGWQQLEVLP
jgi:hypothetical protein